MTGRAVLTRLLRLIYPPDSSCSSCRGQRGIRSGWGVCEQCLTKLPPPLAYLPQPPQNIGRVVSYGIYEGLLEEWIRAFKFQDQRHLDRVLGQLMRISAEAHQLWQPDVITPVPLHRNKYRQRGYNQSLLLARAYSEHTGWPVQSLLIRIRDTVPQFSLTRAQRLVNLSGAFDCASNAQIKGKRILLIDDIYTTGSTLSECAAVLFNNGASAVAAQTVAMTHHDPIHGAGYDKKEE